MRAKRTPALILATLLLWAALPAGASARAWESASPAAEEFRLGEVSVYGHLEIEEPSVPAPVGTAEFFTVREEAAMAGADESGGGTRYDPRGSLPPVRSQGTWSTCWAMAAVAAAEADGLTRGLLAADAQQVDLSERHLIYFLSHPAADPLGNSSGDYNIAPSYWVTSGGNPVIAAMTLANWHGAADETATASPYAGMSEDDYLDPAYAYAAELRLKNTYALDVSDAGGRAALQELIREHGGAVLCLYLSDRYVSSVAPAASGGDDGEEIPGPADDGLGEAPVPAEEPDPADGPAEEPDPADEPAEDSAPTEEPDPADEPAEEPEAPAEPADPEHSPTAADEPGEEPAPAASEPLTADGAALIPLAADGGTETVSVCYYQNEWSTTNHEVLAVGWDDDYPTENFRVGEDGPVPPGNGAWLCRNSMGDGWAGGDGYFWLSYYDRAVCANLGGSISARATVFDFGAPDEFDHSYEYDGAVVLGFVSGRAGGSDVVVTGGNADSRRWYANIFTAAGNGALRGAEALRAVSTYTYRAGVSYTARVYTGLTDAADPTSGTLAAEVSGSFPRAGYHTVTLPESVLLAEGERFSVVFCVGAASDGTIYVPACQTSSEWKAVNDTQAGQSFVSVDGAAWYDGKTLPNEPNVRIKAFTDDTDLPFPFTDVSADAWYYPEVRGAWLRGLVEGVSASAFQPGAEANRAQIVTVLWRLAGEPAPSAAADFPDVPAGRWYSEAVAWAGENGVVTGYTDGTFRPTRAVTRQEFLTILYRFARLRGLDTSAAADLGEFPDRAFVADWAEDAVAWSVGAGLQKGVASGGTVRLLPGGSVTRAQLAAFLDRLAAMTG